jgi:hypothetical protein
MNKYPIRVAGHRGSIMRTLLGGDTAGPDPGVSQEQVLEQTQAIPNATCARIAAGPIQAVAPVDAAARKSVDWAELLRSVTEIS